jgi:CO dehydrogenase nickel-insertion accessory protein CooC1
VSKTISIMGKGGVGKTTIANALLEEAARRGMRALGVDADAQRSLTLLICGEAGASLYRHLAEDTRQRRSGALRDGYEEALAKSLTQAPAGYALLTMGRPTGEGCYCAANAAIKSLVFGGDGRAALAARYDLVVVDCEAGPEKVARRMLTPGSTALIVAMPDPHDMSIHVADDIAAVISAELPQVQIVRLLNRAIDGKGEGQMPPSWQNALRLPDGEAELRAAISQLFDKLLTAVQIEPD